MAIDRIDSFLIYPSLGKDDAEQRAGTKLPLTGRLFSMLSLLYERAPFECKTDIAFSANSDGSQANPCRDLLVHHFQKPTSKSAHKIAQRLSRSTGTTSGLGLLFIVLAQGDRGQHHLVLARFPADQGVLAEEKGGALQVSFIEKVFMKSAHAYKSALYSLPRLNAVLAGGRAIDKQINGPRELSQYWINEFLSSDLATTGAAGTRRLGNALRAAVGKVESDALRGQLVAAAQLIPSHAGQRITASSLLQQIGVPAEGITAVRGEMSRPELMDERFELSADEFALAATYKSVELDNGAMLLAETTRFERVFEVRQVAEGRNRYSTEGTIINQRLRKQK